MNGGSHSPFHGSNASFNTLPRSSSSSSSTILTPTSANNGTPTSTNGGRTLPPRGFGANNYVLKEEYERERVRWQQKLEEAEEKLGQYSVTNTDLAQTKAQLNKKIIDIEKNQKPMLECNRRLAERNRTLMESCKNLEESLSFVRDEKLTLKDQYDRLVKENSSLREQRAFPEMTAEIQHYRTLLLENSKSITNLRNALLDKDRRNELLVQKLRKIKKALLRRGEFDDCQSCIGSEGSADSSIALDTIAEDFDEDPLMVNGELQPTLSEQIAELQAIFGTENNNSEKSNCLISKVTKLYEEHKSLEERNYMLELELATAHDTNDLLEFQLVELTSTKTQPTYVDQNCETDEFLSTDTDNELENEPRFNFDEKFIQDTKSSLRRLYNLFALSQEQREVVRNGNVCITSLEHRLTFAQNQLNMAECEMKRLNKLADEKTAELTSKLAAASETSSQKKKELKTTIENLKAERASIDKEMNALRKDHEANTRNLEHVKEQLSHESTEKENFKKALDELTKQMNEVGQSLDNSNRLVEEYKRRYQSSESKLKDLEATIVNTAEEQKQTDNDLKAQREAFERLKDEKMSLEKQIEELRLQIDKLRAEIRPIGTDLERRYEEEKYRLSEAMKIIHKHEKALSEANDMQVKLRTNADRDQREISQLRKYNTQLEGQFNSQMDIITELKKRYLDLSGKSKIKSESTESIGWASKGSSLDDENYHSEEAHSEENFDTAIHLIK
ncbi:Janus kinase and microtubule-interacting protein 1 [Aphelenchoides besseyi]|nr:Janus kinase and microtubule-interacting protein 1 [Aphelenchoides besseyi]